MFVPKWSRRAGVFIFFLGLFTTSLFFIFSFLNSQSSDVPSDQNDAILRPLLEEVFGDGGARRYYKNESLGVYIFKDTPGEWDGWIGGGDHFVRVRGADPGTFAVIRGSYTKDLNNIYYLEKRLVDADVDTFAVIGSGYAYAKDRNNIYCLGKRLVDADADTFAQIDPSNKYFFKDKNKKHIWGAGVACAIAKKITSGTRFSSGFKEEGFDVDTFESLGCDLVKDRTGYYQLSGSVGEKMELKNPEVLDGCTIKDGDEYFFKFGTNNTAILGKPILPGATKFERGVDFQILSVFVDVNETKRIRFSPSAHVAKSNTDLESVLGKTYKNLGTIDFNKQHLLIILLSREGLDRDYGIKVNQITENDKNINVFYEKIPPGEVFRQVFLALIPQTNKIPELHQVPHRGFIR